MPDRVRNFIIWTLIALFALFNAFKPAMPGTVFEKLLPAVTVLSMLGFVLLLGPRQIGWRRLSVFFAIACVVSWCYESLSIGTDFPFGNYHYTDKMGPKLGTVPLLIMPAYYAICYVSWHLAHLVLDKFDQRVDVLQPLRARHGQERADAHRASRLAEDSDVSGITAKRGNVLLRPR